MASRVIHDRVLRDIDTHYSKERTISDFLYRRIRSKLVECDDLLLKQAAATSADPSPTTAKGKK